MVPRRSLAAPHAAANSAGLQGRRAGVGHTVAEGKGGPMHCSMCPLGKPESQHRLAQCSIIALLEHEHATLLLLSTGKSANHQKQTPPGSHTARSCWSARALLQLPEAQRTGAIICNAHQTSGHLAETMSKVWAGQTPRRPRRQPRPGEQCAAITKRRAACAARARRPRTARSR